MYLALFLWKRRSRFGSPLSVVNMRLGIFLIGALVPCTMAVLGEASYSLGGNEYFTREELLYLSASASLRLGIPGVLSFFYFTKMEG